MNLSFETILGIIFFIVFFILPAFGRKKPPQDEEAAPKPPTAGDGDVAAPGRPATPAARQAQQQPQRAQGPAQASTATRGQTAQPAQPARGRGGPLTAGSMEEALEEIRARVREAQQQEDASRSAGAPKASTSSAGTPPAAPRTGRLVKSDTGGGSLVSGEARRIRDTGTTTQTSGLGREGQGSAQTPRRRAPTQSPLGREGVAEPLEGSRRSRERARKAAAEIGDTGAPGQRLADGLPPGSLAAARLSPPVLATDRNSLVTGMIWHEILSEPAAKRRLRRPRSRHL